MNRKSRRDCLKELDFMLETMERLAAEMDKTVILIN